MPTRIASRGGRRRTTVTDVGKCRSDVSVSSSSSVVRPLPHTFSAASSSKLPAKTATRPHTSCSRVVRNSKLQSMHSRSVCCRVGAPVLPGVAVGQPLENLLGRLRPNRAAASSIGNGNPSSR